MRSVKAVGLGLVSFMFCAAMVGACSASGNDVGGGGGTGGNGNGDAAAATDSSYGASSDSGSGTTDSGVKDSGKSTGIDSGGGSTSTPADAGPGTTCDIGSSTTSLGILISAFGGGSLPSCDSTTPCAAGSCCLDVSAALGGGGFGGSGLPAGFCVTDLSALGL